MIDDIVKDAQARMDKSIAALEKELSKIRTGRATPGLLEHVTVSYYGSDTPLNQVANVAVEDARTLTITPWESNMVGAIEKAIMTSDLGLNPATAGTVIRVPMPPLTEERRRDLVKVVRQEGETSKVSIRNIRRDANAEMKEALKEKMITEDDERRGQDRIQNITDQHTANVDQLLDTKEADLMSV